MFCKKTKIPISNIKDLKKIIDPNIPAFLFIKDNFIARKPSGSEKMYTFKPQLNHKYKNLMTLDALVMYYGHFVLRVKRIVIEKKIAEKIKTYFVSKRTFKKNVIKEYLIGQMRLYEEYKGRLPYDLLVLDKLYIPQNKEIFADLDDLDTEIKQQADMEKKYYFFIFSAFMFFIDKIQNIVKTKNKIQLETANEYKTIFDYNFVDEESRRKYRIDTVILREEPEKLPGVEINTALMHYENYFVLGENGVIISFMGNNRMALKEFISNMVANFIQYIEKEMSKKYTAAEIEKIYPIIESVIIIALEIYLYIYMENINLNYVDLLREFMLPDYIQLYFRSKIKGLHDAEEDFYIRPINILVEKAEKIKKIIEATNNNHRSNIPYTLVDKHYNVIALEKQYNFTHHRYGDKADRYYKEGNDITLLKENQEKMLFIASVYLSYEGSHALFVLPNRDALLKTMAMITDGRYQKDYLYKVVEEIINKNKEKNTLPF